MSALPPKADIHDWDRDVRFVPEADIEGGLETDVRFGSLADIVGGLRDVRFTPESGHQSAQLPTPYAC